MFAKDDIRPGILMIKDAFGNGPAFVKRSKPRGPVRYGEPLDNDFKSITKRLDAARGKLDEIAQGIRNARRG